MSATLSLPGFGMIIPNARRSYSAARYPSVTIRNMNIYISHSGAYDYENQLYKPIKESELSKIHHFFLPHEPENMDTDAKVELRQTDVLVAESSLPSTGQGIELAQADAASVPIICFFKTGSRPSSSLRFVTNKIIEYSNTHDLFAKLQVELDQLTKIHP